MGEAGALGDLLEEVYEELELDEDGSSRAETLATWASALGSCKTRKDLATVIGSPCTWAGVQLDPLAKATIERKVRRTTRVGSRPSLPNVSSGYVTDEASEEELFQEDLATLLLAEGEASSYKSITEEEGDELACADTYDHWNKRQELSHYRLELRSSRLFGVYELLQALSSIFACVLFVYSTFLSPVPLYIVIINYILGVIFIIDFLVHWGLADHKIRYLWSVRAMVDYVTIPPFFITPDFFGTTTTFIEALRALRTLRLITIFRYDNFTGLTFVQQKSLQIVMGAICLVFVVAGLEAVFENMDYLTSIYFVIVTATTVGYGDISPATFWGRLVILAMMIFIFIMLPILTNELLDLVALYEPYSGSWTGRRWLAKIHHVVLVGELSTANVSAFMEEFHHPDRRSGRLQRVLVLHTEAPDLEWRSLMRKYYKRMFFFRGDAMCAADLERVKVSSADGVFVLSNTNLNIDALQLDKCNILRALSVRKNAPKVRTYVQLIRPEYRVLCHNLTKPTHLVCIDRLKLGILARSCTVPGLTTLFGNATRTSRFSRSRSMPEWLREYLWGEGMEIYKGEVPEQFDGCTFATLVTCAHQELDVQVIGTRADFTMEGGGQVEVPEMAHRLKQGDSFYALGQSAGAVKRIKSFGKEKLPAKRIRRLRLLEDCQARMPSTDMEQKTDVVPPPDGTLPRHKRMKYSSAIKKSLNDVHGHIIICAPEESLNYIIAPLRVFATKERRLIVIFYPTLPSQVAWRTLCKLGRILMIKGSPLKPKDLRRVNANSAALMIIARGADAIESSRENSPLNSDTNSSLAYLNIKAQFPHLDVRVELKETKNLDLLRPEEKMKKSFLQPHMMPAFASGDVFDSSMATNLLVQSFFNPRLISLINNVISLPSGCGQQKTVLDLIPIPPNFDGATYSDLVNYFAWERNQLVIGIYRRAKSGKEYVFTAPKAQAVLKEGDRAYAFGILRAGELEDCGPREISEEDAPTESSGSSLDLSEKPVPASKD